MTPACSARVARGRIAGSNATVGDELARLFSRMADLVKAPRGGEHSCSRIDSRAAAVRGCTSTTPDTISRRVGGQPVLGADRLRAAFLAPPAPGARMRRQLPRIREDRKDPRSSRGWPDVLRPRPTLATLSLSPTRASSSAVAPTGGNWPHRTMWPSRCSRTDRGARPVSRARARHATDFSERCNVPFQQVRERALSDARLR